MADRSLVTCDKETMFYDRGDGVLGRLIQQFKGSSSTSLEKGSQQCEAEKSGAVVAKSTEDVDMHIRSDDFQASASKQYEVLSPQSETSNSALHFEGFDITLNLQNDLVFTEERISRRTNFLNDTNGAVIEKKPVQKGACAVINYKPGHISKTQTTDTENVYACDHIRKGYMIYIANENFAGGDQKRAGGNADLRNMEDVRNILGFDLLNPDMTSNLTKSQVRQLLRRIQETDHTNCNGFVFMISTHGEPLESKAKKDEESYGLSCSDGEVLRIREIIAAVNDVNCPTLKGKPKVFFIQACRGPYFDSGNEVLVVKTEPSGENRTHGNHVTTGVTDAKGSQDIFSANHQFPETFVPVTPAEDEDEAPYLLCDNDMLIMFAAPPGMYAWRNEMDGSWIIHDLHKVLMDCDFTKPVNFLKILTKVSALMSRRMTRSKNTNWDGKVVVPVLMNTLTKDIIF